ncbi:MAG: MBL fold metallo-hydrolase [Chitinophagales bacterium]
MNKQDILNPQLSDSFNKDELFSSSPIRIELPTIFGMKTVNTYLFKYPEPTLIDSGENSEASWTALQNGLAANGLGISDIKRVVITHSHIDHIGMAGRICEHSNAEVWVSKYVYDWAVNLDKMRDRRVQTISTELKKMGDSPITENFKNVFTQFDDYWLPIPESRVKIFSLDEDIQLGGQAWQVIYAPGHCISQTCFYQAETKQLLSADMLLRITPTPVIDADIEPPYTRNKGILQLLESYQKFAQLDIDIVYPGHYAPFNNAKEVIKKQVNRIQERKIECLKYIQEGTTDFFSLIQKLYGKNFSMPAIPMLVGYLDLLEIENSIFVLKTPEGLRYFPV